MILGISLDALAQGHLFHLHEPILGKKMRADREERKISPQLTRRAWAGRLTSPVSATLSKFTLEAQP